MIRTWLSRNRKSNYIKVILPVLVLLMIMRFIQIDTNNTAQPHAQQGSLDLSKWDFSADGNVKLDGQWEFYWDKLLVFEDFQNQQISPDLYGNVPNVWTTYSRQGEKLPGKGYATYRLHVKTEVPMGQLLSFRVNTFASAYRLWINDQEVATNGVVAESPDQAVSEYKPLAAVFKVPDKEFDIIVQVANFDFARGGFWYSAYLGGVENIRNLQEMLKIKEIFLLGVLLFVGIEYLGIYLRLREARYNLYFSIFCFLLIPVLDTTGEYFITTLFPKLNFNLVVFIWYFSTSWAVTFLLIFTGELFPTKFSRFVVRAFAFAATGITVMYLVTPVAFYTAFSEFYQVCEAIQIICTLGLTVNAVRQKREGAFLYLSGMLILFITYYHDLLLINNKITSNLGEIAFLGAFTLIITQTLVQSKKLAGAYEEKKFLLTKLQAVDRLKDEFMANTSHELRTPLNGIINIAQGMLHNIRNVEQQQNLSLIISSGKRLANLVNDILDYSKLKHNDIKLNIEAIELHSFLDGILAVFRSINPHQGVELLNEIPKTLPPIKADYNRLVQIFYNLMGNATKFTTAGQIIASANLRGAMIEICIADTGIGIPPDKLEDIFVSFEQIDSSITRKYEGTGLGLSITKHLVELQGGTIRVESAPGRGSKFYFCLPIAAAEPYKVRNIERAAHVPGELVSVTLPLKLGQEGPHILLVDDDLTNLYAAAAILGQEGYTLSAVTDAKEALAIIKRNLSLSLVILDVMMPGISGYELCREIRKSKSVFDLPVLMLTAKTGVSDIVAGFDAGANDYLPKPFVAEELVARVRTLVALKKSVDKALQAELKFLQSQIRPHFIHNALNTVVSISRRDPDRARKLLVEFSHYLRSCFDFRDLEVTVPIERELNFVRAYVALEQARFGEKLRVVYEVEEISIMLPPLILQPIVENAIIHGLLAKPNGGTICVYLIKIGHGVRLGVKDNGVGIREEKLAQLLYENRSERGVGLYNINQRLKKLYGTSLKIESVVNDGTDIFMEIPWEGVGEND